MFNIYGPDLAFLGELDGCTSAAWSDYWDEIGGMNLTAALTERNEQLLQNGFFVSVAYLHGAPGVESEMPIYVICDVERNAATGSITANGKTADYLMKRRSVATPHFADTTIPDAAQSAIEGNLRGLPFTVGRFSGDSRTDILNAITLESATLDEIAFQILRYGGYGRQLRHSGGNIQFLIDPGRDHRRAPEIPVFTDENGAAIGPTVGDDDSSTCNVATAALHFNDKMPELADKEEEQEEYEDGRTEDFAIGETEATGTARRELWCGDIFQGNDETEEEFRARARAQMEQNLQENIRVLNLTADILPRDYGILYRTGDLLRAKAGTYTFERRVTGVNWTMDATGTKCSLRLGPPTVNVLRELKKSKPLSSAAAGGISGARAAIGAANKKIVDLHRKFLNMTITIGEVSAGLEAQIQNFDDFQEAATKVYARVDGAEASLELHAEQIDGISKSVATLLADIVNINTKVAHIYDETDGANVYVRIDGNLRTNGMVWGDRGQFGSSDSESIPLLLNGFGLNLHSGMDIGSDGYYDHVTFNRSGHTYRTEDITSYDPGSGIFLPRTVLGLA